MSKHALTEAREVDRDQAHRNDARRILERVESALEGQHSPEVRWPFELVQNAHDFGARDGEDLVEIEFAHETNSLVVSHNGRIFSIPELKALLSGGSSKEFDGNDTTGRFGTGFLVTHAISTRVDVDGILQRADGQLEVFSIQLNRPAEEARILNNVKYTDDAFNAAQPVSEVNGRPTASFTYYNADSRIVDVGLDRLEQTVPYLFATCHELGSIRVRRSNGATEYRRLPGPENAARHVDRFAISEVLVSISHGECSRQVKSMSILNSTIISADDCDGDKNTRTGLLVILEQASGATGAVILPSAALPRVFVQFPINETSSLPFNIVFNSTFKPKQERDGISMNQRDKVLIKGALAAFPFMVEHGINAGWKNARELARIGLPTQPLGGENTAAEELNWWKEVIVEAAKATASRPIIATDGGRLAALSTDDGIVSFLVPASDVTEQQAIDYEQLHSLALRISNIHLPAKAVARDWERVACEWSKIGLPINRLGLRELTEGVRHGCESIADLPISGDPFRWLADLFLLVSDLPEHISPIPFLTGLVPDQYSQLRDARDLRIDDGISERLKDIADTVAINLRSTLLHNRFITALDRPGYESAKSLAESVLEQPYSESEAVEAILAELDTHLPDDTSLPNSDWPLVLHTSADLISFLARRRDDANQMRRCPLMTADDSVVRLTNNLQVLAPVLYWPESARPYKDLYTDNRLLSNRYIHDEKLKTVLDPLIYKNMVIPHPLFKGRRVSPIDGPLLSEIAPDCPVDRYTYRTHEFGQIAFLANELVPRCGNDSDLAELLLEFVVNVAAREDDDWHRTWLTELSSGKDEQPSSFQTFNSTWPFELKVRSWLPVTDDEDKIVGQVPANETNLQPLLKSEWLRNNTQGIELLHRVFGFRRITLMLENMGPDIESNLVELLQDPELVKSAAANLDLVRATIANPDVAKILSEAETDEIQSIRQELARRKKEREVRERNSDFGYAVQEAVKRAVEGLGLRLVLVDHGYDYEVFPDGSSFTFEVGSYFLEVKTTTTRDVRLTPTQAQKAYGNPNRFVLCVVDLYGHEIKDVWRPDDILTHSKVVTGIGVEFEEIYEGVVELADTDNPVHLRNEQMLRYGVSVRFWEQGLSINEWVRSLSNTIE